MVLSGRMGTDTNLTSTLVSETDVLRAAYNRTSYVGIIEFLGAPNNFLNAESLFQAANVAEEFDQMGARALVLCSEGKHFSAGANFGTGPAEGQRVDLYEQGIRLIGQPLPMVAAVQGGSVGGGVGLALVADLRVASPESYFWINFSRLGFHHGFGLSVTLPRVVGQQAALELLMSSRRIGGEEALKIGLVDEITEADHIRERAVARAAEIAQNGPLATRLIRATMRGDLAERAAAAMAAEKTIQDRLQHTRDFAEGTASIRERRPAAFTGL